MLSATYNRTRTSKPIFFIKRCICAFFFVLIISAGFAQTDTEFPKGFILYGKLHNGMVTDFTSRADLYVGGIQLAAQYTTIEHVLRIGVVAGSFFEEKELQGQFGPSLSLKLKSFNAKLKGAQIGSVGNLNLLVDHLWGTGGQRLAGGGILFDLGNILTVGITAHRDYHFNRWWFQNEIGIRLSKKRKNPVI